MSKEPTLLTREGFREAVFARDKGKCVFCKEPAIDAHHLMERRLFSAPHEFGGYFIDNGASVCKFHHLQCEMTLISVEEVRLAAGITKIILPSHLYESETYDKWGDSILSNGQRVRGELFFDESVQKILKESKVIDLFTNRVKQPRTFHLPWSQGIHDDDRVLPTISQFIDQNVVVNEKLDGENTSVYCDYIHARSIDGRHHSSRNWIKSHCAKFQHEIPQDWRVMIENVYATHSVHYKNLKSYAFGFAIWNERNECLPWTETKEWLELFGVEPCPVLYEGIFDEALIRNLYNEKEDWNTREGYVVRIAGKYSYADYKNCVGKYVRKNHIQTAPHNWLNRDDYQVNELEKT